MLNQDQAADIFQKLKKYSTADEIEVLFFGTRNALTRFANNTIHQNVAEENVVASVRTAFDGRTARATTNKLDDDSLRRVVQASESLARVQHPDPDLLQVPDASEAQGTIDFQESKAAGKPQSTTNIEKSKAAGEGPVRLRSGQVRATQPVTQAGTQAVSSRYFEQTAAVTPEQRADGVARIVGIAQKHQLTTAGIFSSSEFVEGVFNSRGLSDWHTQTSSEISVTMLAADSSGWQKANSPDVAVLDSATLAQIAAEKALTSASPREILPGKYTVILEAPAVLDMVGFMFYDFGGLAILDQRSFLTNRVGTKIFGDNIDIWDDVSHPLQSGSPFDGEGMRRQRVQLVERGSVERLVYARATAEKMKKSEYKDKVGPIGPTGHGFPIPNEIGEAPMNIVFGRPKHPKTLEQMIASTERGILVTRLWYIREVDPYEKILTGMTRDGTFYVEEGKVRHGVLNFRFNESLIHMLSNVEEMGEPIRASGEESFDMVAPPMKVREFNFTEVTKF